MMAGVEPDGQIVHLSGYASLFNVADLSGDRVMVGAFQRSLKARGPRGIRMLWNHDPAHPIGVWTSLVEDARGLRATGRLTPQVRRAADLAALIKDGAVDGLSIGFHTVRADRPTATKGRRLVELDLWEISLVAFPMQPGARIEQIVGRPNPDAPFPHPGSHPPGSHTPTDPGLHPSP